MNSGVGGSLRDSPFFAARVGEVQPAGGTLGSFLLETLFQLLRNPLASLAEGRILPIVAFSMLLGVAMLGIGGRARPLREFLGSAHAVIMYLIFAFLRLAPVGILALIGQVVASVPIEELVRNLMAFALVVVAGTLIHACVTLPAVAALVGLFSKQATDKLEEVFTTLFRTEKGKGDDLRGDKAVDEALVSQHMILLRKIKAYTIPAGKKSSDILVKDLAEVIRSGFTRIPILDHKNIATGVIHQSLFFKYIAEKSIDLQKKQQSFDFDSATLEQLLDYGDMRVLITKTLAFVPVIATVAGAKMAMEQTENCQDVFITQSGSKSEPVLGWLTNVDISGLTESR